jgi:hypothetical protein
MTSANPLRIIKRRIDAAFNRAYHVKKLRGTDAICEYIYEDMVAGEGKVSPMLQKQAMLTLIRDLMVNRLEQLNAFDEPEAHPDLFRDFEYQFTFRKGGERVQCVLGDLDYKRGLSLLKRKESNITAAIHARDEFSRVWSIIGPLLRQNPDWVWRDAVKYLSEHGGIPDAAEAAV